MCRGGNHGRPYLRCGPTDYRSRSPVSITGCLADTRQAHTLVDPTAFAWVVVFIVKPKADNGQDRCEQFFMMAFPACSSSCTLGSHVAMVFSLSLAG